MSTATEDIVDKLGRVDWNFTGSSTLKSSVHSLHWFPGNFIPQLPSYLIQILSNPGDVILDPFCGSGTTGVEAILLCRESWQSDLSSAGVQVARGKMSAYASGVADELVQIGRSLYFSAKDDWNIAEGKNPELEYWFHTDTLAQLRFLWRVIVSQRNVDVRNFLEMLFTDVLFSSASAGGTRTSTGGLRRHHWGWIADNVRPAKPIWHNAVDMFRARIFTGVDVIASNNLLHSLSRSTLKQEDARNLSFPSEGADLVVTSPPYLGMIDYTLANRLTYLWYGWTLATEREREIGARQKRNQKDVLTEYLREMSLVAKQIVRILRPNGHCALVIGASRKYPHAALQLIEVFSRFLPKITDPIPRVPSRRRISERKGTDPIEYICVFQKA